MSAYTSRHQPRRQTTISGKIKDVERYDRYYDIAYDALKSRTFPLMSLSVGRLVVRSNDSRYDARQIPPNSSTNVSNRFSGVRLDGRPGQGALYIGTIEGVLRESTHYSIPQSLWTPAAPDATAGFIKEQRKGEPPAHAGYKFYLYRVNQTLHFADLRITSLTPFMTRLRMSEPQRYGISSSAQVDFLTMAASNPNDYSASRGIADAVYDSRHETGLSGVCALSSRADRDDGLITSFDKDQTGGLIYAIFGAASSVVTALTPVPKQWDHVPFDTFAELSARLAPAVSGLATKP
jgi:hypothetical protein